MTIWKICCTLIAVEHLGFFFLESVLWRKPAGRKIFGLTQEHADLMAPLAANQGLYNGFLAAGLGWAIVAPAASNASELGLFFLACVFIAGVVGGATVKRSIWMLQALPALVGLVFWSLKL